MTMTLEENDILDETEEFERMAIPEDQWYVPAIHLYFKDDLTVKWFVLLNKLKWI